MYNQIILMGRITADPELRHTPADREYVLFSVAVDQFVKDGDRKTDFFRCAAWGKTAVFIASYFQKGSMILIDGAMHNDNYTDDQGVSHYGMKVTVRNVSFTGERRQTDSPEAPDTALPESAE